MSLRSSFQSSLKEACLDYRDCCGPLIITCSSLLLANLFCSMHTQMNINAMEDDSCMCVCECVCCMNTRRQIRIGSKSWNITHKEEHTHSCMLSVLCQVRRLSLLFNSVEEGKLEASHKRRDTHTHATSFPDTLSQQQKDGERKESVLSEINREIIP